ncbi:MAG: transposase [Cocleimonas sp.]
MNSENIKKIAYTDKELNNKGLRYKQLQEFDTEVNWSGLVELIVRHYVESGIGMLKVPVETMIRVYFLQLRYNLNAREAAIALSKIDVLRNFAIINIKTDVLPEEDSIDTFRSLVELTDLANKFSAAFNIQPMKQIVKEV